MDTLNTSGSGIIDIELFPATDNKPILMKDQFNFQGKLPRNTLSEITLDINYESIYFKESNDPTLRKRLLKTFIIDPVKNTITEEVNK